MFTKIDYMYRDASNYKFHGATIVDGEITIEQIQPYLFDGEFFVPTEVGLDHLLDMPMNEDDHYFHTFVKFELAKDGLSKCTAQELLLRFQTASENGWLSSIVNR